MDILSGSYASPKVKPMSGYFYVLWGEDGGKFSAPTPLKGNDDQPLVIDENNNVVRICTRPTAVDWDSDGDLDLLVGNFKGTLYVFKGEGKGIFSSKAEPVMDDGKPVKINSYHSDPFCADVDGDGDLDVLSGSADGGVQWAENTAGPGKEISIKSFQWLIEPNNEEAMVWADNIVGGPTLCTRVFADDVNGDGKLDLLVGDKATVYELVGKATKEEAERKFDEFSKVLAKVMDPDGAGTVDQAALRKEYMSLKSSLDKVVKVQQTGHVWLYLGK